MSDNPEPINLKAQFTRANRAVAGSVATAICSGMFASMVLNSSLFGEPHSLKRFFAAAAITAIGAGISYFHFGKKADAIVDETVRAIQSGTSVQQPKP